MRAKQGRLTAERSAPSVCVDLHVDLHAYLQQAPQARVTHTSLLDKPENRQPSVHISPGKQRDPCVRMSQRRESGDPEDQTVNRSQTVYCRSFRLALNFNQHNSVCTL